MLSFNKFVSCDVEYRGFALRFFQVVKVHEINFDSLLTKQGIVV